MALCFDHTVLDIPQLAREVNVVVMRIIEALDLLPNAIKRCLTVGADLVKRGAHIDLLATLKYGNEQLLCLKV